MFLSNKLDLKYIRMRKQLMIEVKTDFTFQMSCFMHVMSHAHVMLHVTSHILYVKIVNDTSLSL